MKSTAVGFPERVSDAVALGEAHIEDHHVSDAQRSPKPRRITAQTAQNRIVGLLPSDRSTPCIS